MRPKVIAKLFSILVALLFCGASVAAKSLHVETQIHPPSDQVADTPSLGETTTLLPNGTILVLGGQSKDGSITDSAMIRDPQSGTITKLSSKLNFARAWHSASVLPNGTVFILGGIGNSGGIVSQAELFDLQSQTFQLLTMPRPTPRAFHSSTVLTDGRLLIAGGADNNGQLLQTLEVWDFRSGASSTPNIRLNVPRRSHQATLLADGKVLFSGGKDPKNKSLSSADVFDPNSQTMNLVSDVRALLLSDGNAIETRATSPEDGATDVALDSFISMRFSHPIAIQTINSQAATLSGPNGTVTAKVSGAEAGMLAFIIPNSNLLPGTTYTAKFTGGADQNGSSSETLVR